MIMKKIFIVFLAFAFLLPVLTGCISAGDATMPTETTPPPTKEVIATEPDTAPTETTAPTEPDTSFHIRMTFAGDCMLATEQGGSGQGSFNRLAGELEPSYFLAGAAEFFRQDDFTVVNLENVLTDRELNRVEKDHSPAYWYRGPSENARILTAGGVEVVSLDNNHTMDYGSAGEKDTQAAVEAAGLEWGNMNKTVYLEKNGFIIALICHGLWYGGQENDIIRRIKAADEKSDYQIVFFHGGKMRLHEPEDWKVNACRKMADAGADLILGAHPHTLQPEEIYNGVPIVYSLGNFCYGGSARPENRTILYVLDLKVDNGVLLEQTTEIIPYYVYTGDSNNYQPVPIIDEAEKQQVLDFMKGLADSPL